MADHGFNMAEAEAFERALVAARRTDDEWLVQVALTSTDKVSRQAAIEVLVERKAATR